MKHAKRYLLAALITAVLTGLGMPGASAEEKPPPQTGTDPRDFAPKFMPYIRHTELENGLEQNETVLFGLFAFSPKFAMTYEIPLAKDVDISDTALRNPITGVCGPGGFLPGGGVTIPSGLTGFEGDCEETGVGDMNLRFLYRTDWKALGGDWLVGAQFDFPTASEDVLGSESFLAAPMFAYIRDLPQWPGPGAFIAAMNFYFFDISKDSDRADTSMYVGRWFAMLPLSEKHPVQWRIVPGSLAVIPVAPQHRSGAADSAQCLESTPREGRSALLVEQRSVRRCRPRLVERAARAERRRAELLKENLAPAEPVRDQPEKR